MIIRRSCKLCGDECESVVYVLWGCPAYGTSGELENLLGGGGV